MKVLSFKQPYAELVVSGRKTIDLRRWNTNFRGNFLIHASKIPDKKSMGKFGFLFLPTGKIVGEAELIGVKIYSDEEEHKKDKDKHLADFSFGKYGFILRNCKRIDGPYVNGKLNFWEISDEI
ncbi:ASCH domain-containing protein [Candidatus Pacearchaeota archaeon]|nr:ASCH domain-containing protein [Candidatus Pacearchaeota archaeon]